MSTTETTLNIFRIGGGTFFNRNGLNQPIKANTSFKAKSYGVLPDAAKGRKNTLDPDVTAQIEEIARGTHAEVLEAAGECAWCAT